MILINGYLDGAPLLLIKHNLIVLLQPDGPSHIDQPQPLKQAALRIKPPPDLNKYPIRLGPGTMKSLLPDRRPINRILRKFGLVVSIPIFQHDKALLLRLLAFVLLVASLDYLDGYGGL